MERLGRHFSHFITMLAVWHCVMMVSLRNTKLTRGGSWGPNGPQGPFQFVLSIEKNNDTPMKFYDFFASPYVVFIPQISQTYHTPTPPCGRIIHRGSIWTPMVIYVICGYVSLHVGYF